MNKERSHDHFAQLACDIPDVSRVLDAPEGAGEISQRLKNRGYNVVPADILPEYFKPTGLKCDSIDLNRRLPTRMGAST